MEAELQIEEGPDPDVVKATARAGLNAAIAEARRLQGQLPLSAIYAALHVTGIRSVTLKHPAAGVVCDKRHYPSCTSVTLTSKVVT